MKLSISVGRCASARRHGPRGALVARWGLSRHWRDRVGFFLEAGWWTPWWVGWGCLGGREAPDILSLFLGPFYARVEYEFLHKKDRRSVGGDSNMPLDDWAASRYCLFRGKNLKGS